ncbi:MAG: Mur ligase family protein [Bacteroidota bacterium]
MTGDNKRIHFIAIGGAAMHSLALALHINGFNVTGSDDEIFDPAKSRLQAAGLLPEQEGWFADKVTSDIGAIVLGMHARSDNPELLRALELGIPVYSYPEYVGLFCENKQRIVIAGSHGKTTITGMIMHVLKHAGRDFDYLVGAKVEGFDIMCRLSDDAPMIIIEGDEYLASALERVPKFLKYKHHIALVSGIAWDHINVFPTLESYVRQFDHLADATPKAGIIFFNEEDAIVDVICRKERPDVSSKEYSTHKSETRDGQTYLKTPDGKKVPVQVFGEHNLSNISGAKAVCSELGISDDVFYAAISSFKGAANRLEQLASNDSTVVFKDFAHAPSKLAATVKAVKSQFPKRDLVAVLELHTFSSLNSAFLDQYKNTFSDADVACVYYSPQVLEHKKLPSLSPDFVRESFGRPDLEVYTDISDLRSRLKGISWHNKNLLLMSSGNFGGTDLKKLAAETAS